MLGFYPISGRPLDGTPTIVQETLALSIISIMPSYIPPTVYGEIDSSAVVVFGAID